MGAFKFGGAAPAGSTLVYAAKSTAQARAALQSLDRDGKLYGVAMTVLTNTGNSFVFQTTDEAGAVGQLVEHGWAAVI